MKFASLKRLTIAAVLGLALVTGAPAAFAQGTGQETGTQTQPPNNNQDRDMPWELLGLLGLAGLLGLKDRHAHNRERDDVSTRRTGV